MILVCSWGGVGTTALLEFLATRCQVNPARGLVNPLKHPLRPPDRPDIERAVFLHGCPALSLWSLFRRGYDSLHYLCVNDLLPELRFPDEDPWQATCDAFQLHEERPGVWVDGQGRYASDIGALEYLRERKTARQEFFAEVERRARLAYRDFDHFLELGQDLFRRREQLENWRKGASYPILMLRYEELWERLDELEAFLGMCLDGFPPRLARQSSLEQLSGERRARLVALAETWTS